MPRLLASLLPRCAPNQEDLAVLPRLPIERSAHVAGLTALIQQEEWARTELELTADDRDAHGKDSAAIRRRLQRSRPVMGSLRLMRLQVLATRWRDGRYLTPI